MIARILVVDNDRDRAEQYAQWINEQLPDAGCIISDHPDGFQDELKEADPDLVLIDLGAGKITDCRRCRQMKRNAETCRIPLLTICDPPEQAGEAEEDWIDVADACIRRPFEPDDLVNLVRTVLQVGRNRFEMLNREAMLEAELKSRLDQLKEREERFRILFDQSPDAIFIESTDGYVIDVNEAACALHGMTRDELVGRHVTELVPPAIRPSVRERFSQWDTETYRTYESYSYTKDGRSVPVEVRGRTIQRHGENVYLLHVRDITRLKNIQDELQYRLYLHEVVIDIARHLVTSHPDDLEAGIKQALLSVGEAVDAETVFVVELTRDTDYVKDTASWSRSGRDIAHWLKEGDSTEPYHWALTQLQEGRPLEVNTTDQLSATAEPIRALCAHMGLRAFFLTPMTSSGHLTGTLCVGFAEEHAAWNEHDVRWIHVIAEIMGKALRLRSHHKGMTWSE